MTKDWFEGRSLDERHERCYLRRIVLEFLAAILVGLLIAAVLHSGKVHAEDQKISMTATDGSGNVVRITSEPCADTPVWMNLHKAEMRYEGVDYLACWFLLHHTVVLLDSNGDATPIPANAFTKDEPI